MGIENPVHLVFLGVIALLVLGPKRLPELARALGHGIREFREAVSNPEEPRAVAALEAPTQPVTPAGAEPAPARPPEPLSLQPPAPSPVDAAHSPGLRESADPAG